MVNFSQTKPEKWNPLGIVNGTYEARNVKLVNCSLELEPKNCSKTGVIPAQFALTGFIRNLTQFKQNSNFFHLLHKPNDLHNSKLQNSKESSERK